METQDAYNDDILKDFFKNEGVLKAPNNFTYSVLSKTKMQAKQTKIKLPDFTLLYIFSALFTILIGSSIIYAFYTYPVNNELSIMVHNFFSDIDLMLFNIPKIVLPGINYDIALPFVLSGIMLAAFNSFLQKNMT